MSEKDKAPNTLPDDPAVKAVKQIWSRLTEGPHTAESSMADIIRSAYAPLVAERDRLRTECEQLRRGVETEAARKSGIYEHAANAVVERNEIRAELVVLKGELAEARADIADRSQRKMDQDAELFRVAGSLHAAREQIETMKARNKWRDECDRNRLAVNQTLRAQIETMKAVSGEPAGPVPPIDTTTRMVETARTSGTVIDMARYSPSLDPPDDAAEIERLSNLYDQTWLHNGSREEGVRAVRDAVLVSVPPCSHTSEPLTQEEDISLCRQISNRNDVKPAVDLVREIVARRIRPECEHRSIADELTDEDADRLVELFYAAGWGEGHSLRYHHVRAAFSKGVRALAAEFRAGAKRGPMTTDQSSHCLALARIVGRLRTAEHLIPSGGPSDERAGVVASARLAEQRLCDYVNSLLTAEKGGKP